MADKSIGELVAASQIGPTDLFVTEQGGTAKKVTGLTFEKWLLSFADGHGGIHDITRVGTAGLVDTYRITYADTTTSTFTVTNGKAIQSITKTPAVAPSLTDSYRINYNDGTRYDFDVDNGRGISNITWTTSGTAGDGQVHTGTITYNDGTTSTIVFTDGVKGDTGDAVYTHIKYASQQPTSDADMGDVPDDWMGIYTGASESAPARYTAYAWYQIKGAQGNPGEDAELVTSATTYQSSVSGTTIPSGTWLDTIPYVAPGDFLWTRVILEFNTGGPVPYYTVSRQGVDGSGAAGTATPLPDSTIGDVGTSESFSREDHRHPLPTASDIVMQSGNTVEGDVSELLEFEPLHLLGSISSTTLFLSDPRITSDMRVIWASFGSPPNVRSALNWTTSNGRITFTGTLSGTTTIRVILCKTN